MNNKSYFKPLEDYFEHLSESSKHIGSFITMSEGALDDVIANKPIYPFLALVDYEGKLNASDQRTITTRTVTFAILFECKTGDNTEQRLRVNDAEGIGLQILAKIEHDACTNNVTWLHKSFKKESVHFTKLEYLGYENLHGMEFSFDLNIKNPLIYDEEFWQTN